VREVSVWAVVVAAGGGSRFGARKQFASLGGRPMVAWSIISARSVADGVVVVLPEGDHAVGAHGDVLHGADVGVAGGPTRAASVRAGLRALPPDADVVVVHDGARPLASPALFRAVVDVIRDGAQAVVPAVPVVDTLKRVAEGSVVDTVARDGLVCVQTPQAFEVDLLRRAHAGEPDATDDAGLVEALGATVRVVPGEPRNMKVTTPADLEIAQALAAW
jgi:2-C-methyl-D-erythritol 4-phosphate cytidylyltransferase